MKISRLLVPLGAAAAVVTTTPAQAPVRLRSTAVSTPLRLAVGLPPTALAVAGTPSTATLTWAAPAGATGFDVFRAVAPTGSWVKLTAAPITATTYQDLSGFVAAGAYRYRVVAYPGSGPAGFADIPFQAAPPVNPAWVRATRQGTDVVVTWAPVPGATRYAVASASAANFRDVAAPATSVTYRGWTAGTYDIAVGARFDPGPVETAATAWTNTSITLAATSGHYRVVLNGATVVIPTRDDMLSQDGKGDEVYFEGLVEVFDRAAGAPKRKQRLFVPNIGAGNQAQLARAVYGDAGGRFSSRLRAGSLTPQGGLGAGDAIPMGVNPQVPYGQPAAASLPMLLWEGTLNDGREALLVHPAVIEWDGGSGTSEAFPSSRCPADQVFNAPAVQQELGRSGINLPITEPIRHLFTQCQRPLEMKYPDPIAGIAVDREVGPIPGVNDPNAHISVDTYLVLTREKIEATLGARSWAMVRVDRIDRFVGGDGVYVLYLLIERLP